MSKIDITMAGEEKKTIKNCKWNFHLRQKFCSEFLLPVLVRSSLLLSLRGPLLVGLHNKSYRTTFNGFSVVVHDREHRFLHRNLIISSHFPPSTASCGSRPWAARRQSVCVTSRKTFDSNGFLWRRSSIHRSRNEIQLS